MVDYDILKEKSGRYNLLKTDTVNSAPHPSVKTTERTLTDELDDLISRKQFTEVEANCVVELTEDAADCWGDFTKD